MFDLIIENAAVVDGTGKPRFLADIAVEKGKIAQVGDLRAQGAQARKVIDATGKAVCPGFIDVHSHADMTLIRHGHEKILAPLVKQGMTTFVGGNCGMAFAPLGARNRQAIREYIEAFTARDFDGSIEWNTLPELMDAYEKRGMLLNMALLAPHGVMRIEACGLETRTARPEEVGLMAGILDEALEAGAIGLSTGLQYFPGSQSETAELIELGKVLRKHGGIFTSHLRSYNGATLYNAVDEVIQVAEKAGVRAQISHLFAIPDFGRFRKPARKAIRYLSWFSDTFFTPPLPLDLDHRRVAGILEKKKAQGVEIGVDVLPDTTGFTHMLAFFPPWVVAGGKDDIARRLADPSLRAKIAKDIETGELIWPHREANTWSMNFFKHMGWENTHIMSVTLDKNKPLEGRSIQDISAGAKKSPIDVCCDLLLEEQGKVLVFLSMAPPGSRLVERSLFFSLADPDTSICTDTILLGMGRPSHMFHACYPLYLGRYVRDMGLLGLEAGIRKCTSLPAAQAGITDRGRIALGLAADLVVFDPQTIGSKASFQKPDLDPEGIEAVFINGNEIVRGNRLLEGKPGRLLRGGKAS